jgi:cytochrome bd-type quinol oxidase subunit 2
MIPLMRNPREDRDGRDRAANSRASRWNIVALAIAVLTGFGALLLPLGMRSSAESNGVARTTRVSLLSNEGPSVLIVVAIPVLLVALPLMLRGATASYRSRVVIVVLLGILVMLGAMSIGLFFVPTLIAMIVSMSAQAATRSTPPSTISQRRGRRDLA